MMMLFHILTGGHADAGLLITADQVSRRSLHESSSPGSPSLVSPTSPHAIPEGMQTSPGAPDFVWIAVLPMLTINAELQRRAIALLPY